MPEYLPAPHGSHVLKEAAPKWIEYMPIGQKVHVAFDSAPISSEYVPCGHGTQTSELAPHHHE